MINVISEARKELRRKANSKRQGITDGEIINEIRKPRKKVKSEKDLWERLGDLPPFLRTGGRYQKFIVDPNRIQRLCMNRNFFFPGYGARILNMECLTIIEANVALGMAEGKLRQLVLSKQFPTPLGKCYLHYNSNSYPAYTKREVLIYMHLLASMIGSPGTLNWWQINKEKVIPTLFAAREEIRKGLYEKGENKWKIRGK